MLVIIIEHFLGTKRTWVVQVSLVAANDVTFARHFWSVDLVVLLVKVIGGVWYGLIVKKEGMGLNKQRKQASL